MTSTIVLLRYKIRKYCSFCNTIKTRKSYCRGISGLDINFEKNSEITLSLYILNELFKAKYCKKLVTISNIEFIFTKNSK